MTKNHSKANYWLRSDRWPGYKKIYRMDKDTRTHMHTHMHTQTDRQTEGQIHTHRQTDRHTDRETHTYVEAM